MTSTPSGLSRVISDPAPGAISPAGGVDPVSVWYLAICHRCGEDLAEPFIDDEDARDDWAAVHVAHQGHTVQLTIDGFENLAGLHMTGLIRRELNDGDGFKFLCPAADCERWNGPYPTPQLAILAWRAHHPAVRA